MSVHYLDENFCLIRAVPAIKYFNDKRHTAENIADVLGTEIESVKCDSAMAVLVTDNASNMKKTRSKLKERGIIDQEFGCVNHSLQNAVKAAFKDTVGVDGVVKKAKLLSKHLR